MKYLLTCDKCGKKRKDEAKKLAYWWEDHLVSCVNDFSGGTMVPIEEIEKND